MKLSNLKDHLNKLLTLNFEKPDGEMIPAHFHITEVGLITKHFLDCGIDVHLEKMANIQIWVADDTDHRLSPKGLLRIINQSKRVLGDEDLDIEIEYQTDTIGKYGLEFAGENFVLIPKQTDCLAKLKCGIPQPKQKLQLAELVSSGESCCVPGGGCC